MSFVTKNQRDGHRSYLLDLPCGGGDDHADDSPLILPAMPISGETTSSNFPTANAFQGTYGGGASDAFVTKLNSSGPDSSTQLILAAHF